MGYGVSQYIQGKYTENQKTRHVPLIVTHTPKLHTIHTFILSTE